MTIIYSVGDKSEPLGERSRRYDAMGIAVLDDNAKLVSRKGNWIAPLQLKEKGHPVAQTSQFKHRDLKRVIGKR